MFPWKFVFHLLLVVLCTYQALRIVSIQDKHTRIQEQVFSSIYLQNEDGTSSYPYYSLTQFTDTFFQILNSTDTLGDKLLQYSDVTAAHYRLEVYYSEMDNRLPRDIIFQGDAGEFLDDLARIPLSPGNYPQMKQFIQEVESMRMQISNLVTFISMDSQGKMNACLNWTLHIRYSFQSFANVQSELEALSNTCAIDQLPEERESLVGVHISVMVLSVLSLLASWRQVYQVSKEYMISKKDLANTKSSFGDSRLKSNVDWKKNWEELGFLDKMKFFDFWFVIIVTGNFFQLFGAMVALLD